MARVLITGGAGFIGSHIADRCLAEGHAVSVVDSLVGGSRDNLAPAVDFHEIDIRAAELEGVFAAVKPDYVFHLAAQMDVRRSLDDPAYDADVNVLGMLNLLECCRRHGVKKVMFASTGGAIYGEPAVIPADEATTAAPLSHYGTSKLCGEEYLKLYHRLYGLDYTILRYPNVYGPRQNPHGEAGVCAIFIGRMLSGESVTLYGDGAPTRDYVYVGDIARGSILAMQAGSGATLNFGSAEETSVRTLYEIIARELGFTGKPALKPLRTGEVARIAITGTAAAEVLGWRPEVSLDEGLRRTIEHMRTGSAHTP